MVKTFDKQTNKKKKQKKNRKPEISIASDKALFITNRSESALFVIKYVNFYQKPGSSNLIGWKLEVGVAS